MTKSVQREPAFPSLSLPEPDLSGPVSVEAALQGRRSCRDYNPVAPLSLVQAGQLLWATQGITEPERERRTAPSAGARYPLELTLAVSRVEGLEPGLYRYYPAGHRLGLLRRGDWLSNLAQAAAEQTWMADAALIMAISAVFQRTLDRYGERGRRYVHLDAGIAIQNACLQVEALGLGAVIVGAFDDGVVRELLALPAGEMPLMLLPVGRIA